MERRENWLRIHFLLGIANKRLQQFFKNQYEVANSSTWTQESGASFSDKEKDLCKLLNKDQKALLRNSIVEEWDISMLGTLLQPPFLSGFDSHKAHIKRLREIRNSIVHNASLHIPDENFYALWDEMETILIAIGETPLKLAQLKNLDFIKMEGVYQYGVASQDMENFKKIANDHFNAKNYSEALEYYGKAIRIPDLSDVDRGTLYSNRSAAHMYLENYEPAHSDAKLSIRFRPNWPRAYYRKGRALAAMRKLDKALIAYDCGLVIDPTNEELLQAKGEATHDLAKRNRSEHMDSNFSNYTIEDLCKRFSANQKFQIDPSKFEKMIDEMAGSWPYAITLKGLLRLGAGEYKEGAKLLESAVEKGDIEAMYNLALCYLNGKGVSRNIQHAKMLFEKAATSAPIGKMGRNVGVREAQNALGNMYLEGSHGHQNQLLAVEWFNKAIANGDDGAANTLGVLYMNGTGVKQDYEKSHELFYTAATNGFSRAMSNLGELYLYGLGVDIDGEKAVKWFKKASESGFKFADTLLPSAEEVAKEQKTLISDELKEWEREQGYSAESLTAAERIHRRVKHTPFASMDEITKRLRGYMPQPTGFKAKEDKFSFEILSQYAPKSPIAAKLLKGKILYGKALIALEDGYEQEYITQMAAALRISELIAPQIPMFHGKIKETLEKFLKIDPDNKDTMMVYVNYRMAVDSSLEFVIQYLNTCIKAHPKAAEFYHLRGSFLCFQERWEESIPMFNKAIEVEPNVPEFYHLRGAALRNITGKYAQAAQDFKHFLKHAHPDERKIPTAYYSLAIVEMMDIASKNSNNNNNKKIAKESLSEVVEYYQLGMQAEKKLLPCFLPFEFPPKNLLETMLQGIRPDLFTQVTADISQKPNSDFVTKKLNNTRRIRVRHEFRTNFHGNKNDMPTPGHVTTKTTVEGLHTQVAPKKLAGLKEISLDDMDFNADKVYEGYCITGTLIDPSSTLTAIHSIFEDDKGQVIMIAFYNAEKLSQMISVGQTVTIMNPYMRQSVYSGPMLRVDDPKSIVFGDWKDICWSCCRSELKLSTCARCKKAKYCSKECQQIDWKTYEHRVLCE